MFYVAGNDVDASVVDVSLGVIAMIMIIIMVVVDIAQVDEP